MLLPYEVEVFLPRLPLANLIIIVLCFVMYGVEVSGAVPDDILEALVQNGWNPVGFIGSLFLHADFFHVFFNMLYLYIFGNVICAKLGNLRYTVIYLFLGVMSGMVHQLL